MTARANRWNSALALMAIGLGATLFAQGPKDVPQNPGPEPHNISGFWELRDEPGYGGMAIAERTLKPSVLLPSYAKLAAEEKERMLHPKAGDVVSGVSRYCLPIGVPFIMGQSPPLDIVQGKDEILIFSEQHSSARHIYMDGRQHPSPEMMVYTTDGHSIGHWEGDTLVVDTIGFIDQPGGMMLGGGTRGHTSRLVEHFKLIDNGKKLTMQASWTDPRIFAEPRSYEWTFFTADPTTFAMDEFCDAGDAAQGRSVVPPPQK